ncbi:MAG: hypothetical protein JWO58_1973 [Chitinophagaceae bacterium]|nr:hypothetical protein [Chitinophagaceae bacterium]
MKKYTNFFILLSVFFTLGVMVHSCKLKTVDPSTVNLGYDFCPLEIGRYVIYEEYDTVYNSNQMVDTVYNVKELIHDTIMEGKEVRYVFYHFTKKTTDTDWPIQPDSVWTYENNGNQLIREESNIQYIKIAFPVAEGKTWNGNALNVLSDETSSDKYYKMTDIDKSYPIQPLSGLLTTYSNTLKLTISNQADPIVSKDIRYEVYARGIGLIKRDYTVYYYKQDNSPPQTIDFGSRKIMLITSYGKE